MPCYQHPLMHCHSTTCIGSISDCHCTGMDECHFLSGTPEKTFISEHIVDRFQNYTLEGSVCNRQTHVSEKIGLLH